jgi:hypothetical protein
MAAKRSAAWRFRSLGRAGHAWGGTMRGGQDRRLSVREAIKLLQHPLGLFSLIALIGIASAEIASKNVRHVFATYPVSVGLLTGLITLAFTLSIVNQFLLQRASFRWADVRGITLKGLNDEIRSTRDILWIALFGQAPYESNSQMVSAAADIAKQSNVQFPEVTNGLFVGLSAVLPDGQWAQTGAAILRMATREIREGLVRWAPTTGLAGGDYHVLSPIASLADIVETLEFPLATARRDQAGSVADKYRQPLCVLWRHALTTCVYVEENIVRLLDPGGGWVSRARELLSDCEQEDLKQWLADAVIFEKDTANREYALLRLIDGPR